MNRKQRGAANRKQRGAAKAQGRGETKFTVLIRMKDGSVFEQRMEMTSPDERSWRAHDPDKLDKEKADCIMGNVPGWEIDSTTRARIDRQMAIVTDYLQEHGYTSMVAAMKALGLGSDEVIELAHQWQEARQ